MTEWRSNGFSRSPPGLAGAGFEPLDLCRSLPRTAAVLDLGCGVGGQTLHLAELLPDEARWNLFYTPMERRIEELRAKHAGDAEALGILDRLAQEPEMHRRHSDCYAYEFFIARRPTRTTERNTAIRRKPQAGASCERLASACSPRRSMAGSGKGGEDRPLAWRAAPRVAPIRVGSRALPLQVALLASEEPFSLPVYR